MSFSRISSSTKSSISAARVANRSTRVALSTAAELHDEQNTSPFPHLFEPLDLGPDIGVLPNRAIMGSMHSGLEGHSMPRWMLPVVNFATGSRFEQHDMTAMAKYFETRARGGVGLMVTGGIAPNREGWTGPFSSQLTNTYEMEQHKVVTEAVHGVQVPMVDGSSTSSRIVLQILHTGRYAYHPWAVSASSTQSPISPFQAKALDKAGVKRTIQDYVNTALLAKHAGYDGVEIMGSEGYLISQFLAPRTNKRTDEYGGSLENRARFPLEIIRQTREAVGNDFIIIFRLSLLDLVEDGLSFEESVVLAQQVQNAGATIINTGIGWHEARVPTIATSVPRGAFAFPTQRLREAGVVDIPLVSTNRINDPHTADDLLRGGASDLISMARPFLADPNLLEKARQGNVDEINTCIGCNQACLDHVFVGKIASCLVNPAACHEDEFDLTLLPPDQRLKIGVVGAGPAGCSFAIAAAQKGHQVTLYDRDSKVGGQFNMAKRIPGKEEFYETLRYFGTMLDKLAVRVELNSTISVDDLKADTATDKWVLATGVDPRDPKIDGQDHPNVCNYFDVLKGMRPIGKKVAVIGAGGIGFDVSEYLLNFETDKHANDVCLDHFWKEWGIDESLQLRGGLCKSHVPESKREIILLQRKQGKLGAGLGKTTGWIHRSTLKKSGAVKMMNGVTYERIDQNGHLHIVDSEGKKSVLQVDNIVVCAGQVEKRDLLTPSLSDKLYLIGGAYAAGELDAKRAIDMGTRLACKIHEPSVIPGKHVFSASVGLEEKLHGLVKRR